MLVDDGAGGTIRKSAVSRLPTYIQGKSLTFANGTTMDLRQAAITVATPTANTHAATKKYVDDLIQGLDVKDSVVAATTGNISLNGQQTIDGVSVLADERVLVKDQTEKSANGIYLVVDGGAWTRTSDFNANTEIKGSFTFVEGGTTNGNKGFVSTNSGTISIGTTEIEFTQFSSAGEITAGTGLTKSGTTLSVNAAQSQITSIGTSGTNTAFAGPVAANEGVKFTSTNVVTLNTAAQSSGNSALSIPDLAGANGNMVVHNLAQTLTNKTLTAPKFANGGFIADAAGLELIKFSQTGTAVNEITVTNAATSGSPSITATGGDTNVDLTLGAKGTGTVKFTTNSTRGLTFDFDGTAADTTTTLVASSTANRTLTLPDVAGTLVSTGDSGSVTNAMLAGSITTAKLASDIGVTRTLTAYASAGSNKVASGAITVPAGSLITKITAVVITELNVTNDSNATTIKVGNAADGNQIAAAVNIQAGGTAATVAAGLGSSTDTAITTNLTGAAISLVSGKAYVASSTDLHITVENASNISAGAVSFVVEYMKLATS